MNRRLTPDERDLIVEMTKAGASARHIARTLGFSTRTVTRVRTACGVGGSAARPYTEEELAIAERLLIDGASYKEVGRTIGRSPERLAVRFPGYGFTPQEKGAYGRMCALANEVL